MKRLWAPWRMEYILDDNKHDSCLFCDVSKKEKNRINKTRDKKNLILHRSKKCFVMLNKYPYNSGHLMVIPYFHTSSFDGLDDDVLFDLIKNMERSTGILKHVLNPDGFNMGQRPG